MNCEIFLKKYKNILEKLNNNIEKIKVNSDDPLVTSYIFSDLNKVKDTIKSIENFDELLKKCIKINE
jgi:hypothetical protein